VSEPATNTVLAGTVPPDSAGSAVPAMRQPRGGGGRLLRTALVVVGLAAALVIVPVYVPTFWLQALLLAGAAAIGALGLDLQAGHAGQLSLGHAAFLACGAYAYCFFAGSAGLSPVLALIAAVVLTGVVGACISPVASRVRGIQLGVASLGLVYVAQYVLINGGDVTGGFLGRSVPPMSIGPLAFDGSNRIVVLGVPFGRLEMLWLLVLPLAVLSFWAARNIERSMIGVRFRHIRDDEISAACLGVNVRRVKAAAFVVSASYAGLAGVLTALVFSTIVPDYFNLHLSVQFLFMTVIAGMASSRSAVIGALVVVLAGQALIESAGTLGLAQSTDGGMTPQVLAEIVFSILLVVALLFTKQVRRGAVFLGGPVLTRTGRTHTLRSRR
jgi:branched-chain amino acid transport system permease protein